MRSCSIMLTTAASFGCISGVSSGVRLLSTPLWVVASSSRLPICCRNCSVRSAICNAQPCTQHAMHSAPLPATHNLVLSMPMIPLRYLQCTTLYSACPCGPTQQASSHTVRFLTHNKVPHTQQGSSHTTRFLTHRKVPQKSLLSSQLSSFLRTFEPVCVVSRFFEQKTR